MSKANLKMSFQSSATPYTQMAPTFGFGHPYANKYHNMGQLTSTPYGKYYGVGGGYGPVQESANSQDSIHNPTSVYPPDQQFNPLLYLPTRGRLYPCKEGVFPSIETQYPYSYHPCGQNPFFGNYVDEVPPYRRENITFRKH